MVLVEGADAADDWIAERAMRGDVCITADIPLASRCLAKGARALGFKGRPWTPDSIGGALAGRAVSAEMRERGMQTGGPAPLTTADRSRFLSALDAEIAGAKRDDGGPAAARLGQLRIGLPGGWRAGLRRRDRRVGGGAGATWR